jgi:hypothetical protein
MSIDGLWVIEPGLIGGLGFSGEGNCEEESEDYGAEKELCFPTHWQRTRMDGARGGWRQLLQQSDFLPEHWASQPSVFCGSIRSITARQRVDSWPVIAGAVRLPSG